MQENDLNFAEEILKAKQSLPISLTEGLDLQPQKWDAPLIQDASALSTCIDHTLLKPDATKQDIYNLCEEARRHLFFSVCVNTTWVSYAKNILSNSEVKVATTVGFPLGAMRSKAKWEETRIAIEDSADEVDMVMNIGAFKSQDYNLVFEDIARIKEVCGGRTLKVILETGLLTNHELLQAAILSKAARADFLKTSTGFVSKGASVDVVKRLRAVAGNTMGVKASGGIRNTEIAKQMIAAGANRLGCSASLAIIGKGQVTGAY